MSRSRKYRLGDLQLRILKILWERGAGSVSDVYDALEPGLAYTTVATMLRKMEARKLVKHRSEGRRFIYSAVVDAESVSQSMTDYVVDRVFEGSLADMVSHLLTTREISPDELRRLEKLIAARRKRS